MDHRVRLVGGDSGPGAKRKETKKHHQLVSCRENAGIF